MPYAPRRPDAYYELVDWDESDIRRGSRDVTDLGPNFTGLLDVRGHELVWHPDPIGFLTGRRKRK